MSQRCPSPLVLLNNVPPQLNSHNTRDGAQSPLISDNREINPFKVFREQEKLVREDHCQLPKRTVSLGPKRLPPQPRPIGESLKRNPWMQENSSSDRERRFNKAANELRSSLTELNNLIDSTSPSTPKPISSITGNKSPFLRSYVSETPPIPRPTFVKKIETEINNDYYEPPSPPKQIQTWNVEADLMDWKSRGSMNDLRSMFEKQTKLNQPGRLNSNSSLTLNVTDQRPPRSASPSVLKNSFWLKTPQTNETINNDDKLLTSQGVDYTIRRTTSTSSTRSSIVRNPYRSSYGRN